MLYTPSRRLASAPRTPTGTLSARRHTRPFRLLYCCRADTLLVYFHIRVEFVGLPPDLAVNWVQATVTLIGSKKPLTTVFLVRTYPSHFWIRRFYERNTARHHRGNNQTTTKQSRPANGPCCRPLTQQHHLCAAQRDCSCGRRYDRAP